MDLLPQEIKEELPAGQNGKTSFKKVLLITFIFYIITALIFPWGFYPKDHFEYRSPYNEGMVRKNSNNISCSDLLFNCQDRGKMIYVIAQLLILSPWTAWVGAWSDCDLGCFFAAPFIIGLFGVLFVVYFLFFKYLIKIIKHEPAGLMARSLMVIFYILFIAQGLYYLFGSGWYLLQRI